MNVLVVDDLMVNRKLLRVNLEAAGHTVFEAPNGLDALETLGRQRIEAVVSDVLMPGMDGFRFCQKIREEAAFHDVAVILCSSNFDADGDEVMEIIKENGGMEKISLAFYQEKGEFNEKEQWTYWRLEGPGFVWSFRSLPHVHTFVNITSKLV